MLSGVMVAEGLSPKEVAAFTEMFTNAMSAGQLLESIGLHRGSQPGWNVPSAEAFWWEVSRLLAAGKVPGGRRHLLAAAREQFPAHRLFVAGDDAPPEPAVWNVPPRLARFIGREEQLLDLAGRLTADQVVSVVALAGMGGVGKTALAVEYAWRHEGDFDVVWWIEAEQAELVPGSLAELGERLELPAGAEPAAVFAELRRRGKPWLLVFDNAEDVRAVAPFRPADGRGRVLVTSRRTVWGGLGAMVEVPTLPRPESVALLTGRQPEADPEDADRVAELLGDLALALEQAAAFCEQNSMPLSDLVGLLAERLDDMLEQGEVADRAGVTVATLWELSTRRLTETVPAAVELLELLALCSPDPLPLDLFVGHAGLLGGGSLAGAVGDRLAWGKTVGALVGYSLARRDGRTVTVHRLIAAATRAGMDPVRRAEADAMVVGLLAVAVPGDVDDPAGWVRWRELLPHVRTVLDNQDGERRSDGTARDVSWLCDRIGMYLEQHGRPETAIPYLRRGLALDLDRVGPDHPDTLTARANLAGAYRAAGRVGEAIGLFEQVLADHVRVLGPDHPDTLGARHSLAYAYRAAGRVGEAIGLFEQVLADTVRVLGPDHPNTLGARHNLAGAYESAGRVGEAIDLYEQVLTDTVQVLSPDHPNLLTARANLAGAYRAAGRVGEAIGLLEQVLADHVRVLGPDHPDTLTARHNLAYTYRAAGRVGEAIGLFEQVLADHVRVLGPDHPNTLTARANLAGAYESAGRVGEAIHLYEQVLTDTVRVLGPDHPSTLGARHNLAYTYETAGRVGEAIDLYEQVLTDTMRVLGRDHPTVVVIRDNLGAAKNYLER